VLFTVAGRAKGDEVARYVAPALAERLDVMDFLAAILFATVLAGIAVALDDSHSEPLPAYAAIASRPAALSAAEAMLSILRLELVFALRIEAGYQHSCSPCVYAVIISDNITHCQEVSP
jgi:hypothetical protein